MMWFGEDFKKAKSTWAYPTNAMQNLWPAIWLVLFLFILNTVLQVFIGLTIQVNIFDLSEADFANGISQSFLQSLLIAVFPAACIIVPMTLHFARFGMPGQMGRLPLSWPKLGVAGWTFTLVAFVVLNLALMNAIFYVSGLDPLESRGEVEKAMAQVGDNKWMALAIVPSLVLGASFVEELLFRGILFAGIMQTRFGATGAVLITSSLWAAAHAGAAPLISVIMLFFMGIILGLMLLRFGSLWVPIIAHALWNAMMALALFGQGV